VKHVLEALLGAAGEAAPAASEQGAAATSRALPGVSHEVAALVQVRHQLANQAVTTSCCSCFETTVTSQ
jgi:hypothetical protein